MNRIGRWRRGNGATGSTGSHTETESAMGLRTGKNEGQEAGAELAGRIRDDRITSHLNQLRRALTAYNGTADDFAAIKERNGRGEVQPETMQLWLDVYMGKRADVWRRFEQLAATLDGHA